MKPHVLVESMAANSRHLLNFAKLVSKIDPRYISHYRGRDLDRLMTRSVRILEVLFHEKPKVYDDLQFLRPRDCLWVFLYTQSGTRVKECVHLIANLVARKEGAPDSSNLNKLDRPGVSKHWLKFGYDWVDINGSWCRQSQPNKA